jgi:hypothetical protein
MPTALIAGSAKQVAEVLRNHGCRTLSVASGAPLPATVVSIPAGRLACYVQLSVHLDPADATSIARVDADGIVAALLPPDTSALFVAGHSPGSAQDTEFALLGLLRVLGREVLEGAEMISTMLTVIDKHPLPTGIAPVARRGADVSTSPSSCTSPEHEFSSSDVRSEVPGLPADYWIG